jgi:hypothetical protein
MSAEMAIPANASHDHHGKTTLGALEWLALVAAAAILAFLIYDYVGKTHVAPEVAQVAHSADPHAPTDAHASPAEHGPPAGYEIPPVWACLPFVAILL